MFASGSALKLGLNDLFNSIGPDLNHTLIVCFTSTRHTKYMLAGSN
jgi:hypothetical protein